MAINPTLQGIINDIEAFDASLIKEAEDVGSEVVQVAEEVGEEIFTIAKSVFSAEEQQIMTQLGVLLKNEAVALQNAQPGIDSKQMGTLLESTAISSLAGIGAQLAYTGIVTTIGTVMKQLNVQDAQGNAGQVS